jgi:TonB family protein
LGDGNGGIALNVSEGGIAVQAVMSLGGDDLPSLRIQLAHSKEQIEAEGRVAWTGDLRKLAGVEFVNLSEESRMRIREWIALETPAQQVPAPAAEAEDKHGAGLIAETITNPAPAVTASPETLETTRPIDLPAEAPASTSKADDSPALPKRPRVAVVPAAAVPPAFVPGPYQPIAEIEAAAKVQAPPPEIRSDTNAAEANPREADLKERSQKSFRLDLEPERAAFPPRPTLLATPRDSADLPPDRCGFKKPEEPAVVFTGPAQESSGKGKLVTWVAIFTVTALAAGWFAGNANLRETVQRFSGSAANTGAAAENPVESPPPSSPANTSDIQVVDLHNHRWLIPIEEASGRPGSSTSRANSAATADQNTTHLPVPGSLAPAGSPGLSQSSAGTTTRTPSVVAPSSSGAGTVVPLSDASGSPGPALANGDLQPGELIHKVEPVYPPEALTQKVEGTVKILAVIGMDGTVETAQPLSGPPVLVPAALDAVRQWRYSPTLLRGQPIESQRQISIAFQISKTP